MDPFGAMADTNIGFDNRKFEHNTHENWKKDFDLW